MKFNRIYRAFIICIDKFIIEWDGQRENKFYLILPKFQFFIPSNLRNLR